MQTNQQNPLKSLPDYGEAFRIFKNQVLQSSKMAQLANYPEACGTLLGASDALILKTELPNPPAEPAIFGYCAD